MEYAETMDEDMMMIDQGVKDMEIDGQEPHVGSSNATSATRPNIPSTSRRRLPKSAAAKRHGPSRNLPGNNIAQHSSTSAQMRDVSRRQQKKESRAQSANVGAANPPMGIYLRDDPFFWDEPQRKPEMKFDVYIVAQALCAPVPGLSFTAPSTCCLSEDELDDLQAALVVYQRVLARKVSFVPFDNAHELLEKFVRELLATALENPGRFGSPAMGRSFWGSVIAEYKQARVTKWQYRTVKDMMRRVPGGQLPFNWKRVSPKCRKGVILRALKNTPGTHKTLDRVVAEMRLKEPPIAVSIWASTLEAVMRQYEAARTRYLSNLYESYDPVKPKAQEPPKPKRLFGMPEPYRTKTHDLKDGDDGAGGDVSDIDAEDQGQVDGRELAGTNLNFIIKLDKWMALKNGQQQGIIDDDMFSALAQMDIN
ncbi:hypothetical protein Daus18300_012851 [Diaporthe australafricana]|uniref:Uncharacterized protein n=1 Tax=Diaporthe australafricana TaxID=127596 RepID=A0ABR3W117_9PEZI